jgi:chromatin segregation and condensation protein Rec8/ScpA/Scc1 (kleisin family)
MIMSSNKTQKSGLLSNLKAFVGLKEEKKAKVATPAQKTAVYVEKLEASDSVKDQAERLMRQGITTKEAVQRNLDKAEERKQSQANDQAALGKLMTDLEAIAKEVLVNQEKTKQLHEEASVLEQSNKEVIDVLSGTSFAQILAATKAAQNKPEEPTVAKTVNM